MTPIQELEEENSRDKLTNLLNRRAIRAVVEASQDRVYGVLEIDIDHLKRLNTQYGHHAGDVALVEFAKRLTEVVGDDTELARTGGDEFLAVLPDATLDSICAVAKRVCERVRSKPFDLPGGEATALTTSIGVACAPWHGATLEAVWGAAEMAMYQAKRGGRDRWTLATY